MRERFGWVSSQLKSGGIVVHAASVGEVIAVKPFVDKLILQYPDTPITVTTFTPTGSAQVIKSFKNKVQHCYLPLDISFCVHLFFKLMKPKALVLMETELWPTVIQRCYKSNIPLLLINGRLSDNSLKSYGKLTWLITPALNKFSAILCQSEDNADNFKMLGANPSIVSVSGNLKYDIDVTDAINDKINNLNQFVDIDERKILVVGSSHDGEEEYALNAYQSLKQQIPQLLLVIVPRHPERFDTVAKIAKDRSLNVVRRSDKHNVNDSTDVWLIDTLGELVACYAISDISIIAGSFSNVGGHNPLEAALFAKPIIVGTNMANFRDMNDKLIEGRGIFQLENNQQLGEAVSRLIADPEAAAIMGNNALQVVKANQGATSYSTCQLTKLLEVKSNESV